MKHFKKRSSIQFQKSQKKKHLSFVFYLKTMGIFVMLFIILGFIAGALRQELALSFAAALFSIIWIYCLLMTLLSALLHCKYAKSLCIRIGQQEILAGERTEVFFESCSSDFSHNTAVKKLRLRIPGILARYRLLLHTADDRKINCDFNPEKSGESFSAPLRGAYYSDYDEYAVFDILGFFRFSFRICFDSGFRLLVSPSPASETAPVIIAAGGTEHLSEIKQLRSDNLINNRPYIPGDDPRRINWKLYGHGNELFVREGEKEPPPHSNTAILTDTHYDPLLYTADSGRQALDLLCEHSLTCALELMRNGINVKAAFTDLYNALISSNNKHVNMPGKPESGTADTAFFQGAAKAEITAFYARPAAIQLTAGSLINLPLPPADCSIILFALPRAAAEASALDKFLDKAQNMNKTRPIELVFIYRNSENNKELDEAAEICAGFYKRRPGLHVRLFRAE